jgi:hypothetical protein
VPKRRNFDRENINAVVEIAPKPSLFHHLAEVSIRGRHQAKIDVNRPASAQPLKFLFLESSQEFRLKLNWKICNFI